MDSEYNTARRSLESNTYPSLILPHYDKLRWTVQHVEFVHRASITLQSLAALKPLSERARRYPWQGCKILLHKIPEVARVKSVHQGVEIEKSKVTKQWDAADRLFKGSLEKRGWTSDVLRCVDQLYSTFTIENMYKFEEELKSLHPENMHVKDKIRQQLQLLRDAGYVEFIRKGVYRRIKL